MAGSVSLISRVRGTVKRAGKTIKRTKARVTRKKNPSAEARAAVVGHWAAWATERNLNTQAIKNGIYVLKTMPDPTRVKSFSDIAKAVGHRVNPARKAAATKRRLNPPPKRHTLRKASSGQNWAVAEKVSEGKFKIIGWYPTQERAVETAEWFADKSNKPFAVISRAKVVAMRRH
jgi:hypothetical protein